MVWLAITQLTSRSPKAGAASVCALRSFRSIKRKPDAQAKRTLKGWQIGGGATQIPIGLHGGA
jgi:hypothetical protein